MFVDDLVVTSDTEEGLKDALIARQESRGQDKCGQNRGHGEKEKEERRWIFVIGFKADRELKQVGKSKYLDSTLDGGQGEIAVKL